MTRMFWGIPILFLRNIEFAFSLIVTSGMVGSIHGGSIYSKMISGEKKSNATEDEIKKSQENCILKVGPCCVFGNINLKKIEVFT